VRKRIDWILKGRTFTCPACGRSFRSPSRAVAHERRVGPEDDARLAALERALAGVEGCLRTIDELERDPDHVRFGPNLGELRSALIDRRVTLLPDVRAARRAVELGCRGENAGATAQRKTGGD